VEPIQLPLFGAPYFARFVFFPSGSEDNNQPYAPTSVLADLQIEPPVILLPCRNFDFQGLAGSSYL